MPHLLNRNLNNMRPIFYIDPKSIPSFGDGVYADTVYVTNSPTLDDCTLPIYGQGFVEHYNQLQKELIERDKAIDALIRQRDIYCKAYLEEKAANGNQS